MNNNNKEKITLVTGNKNKLLEIVAILGNDFPYEVVAQDIDLPEYQGEPEEIAIQKCLAAKQSISGPVMTEDTSLCFNAMNGLPGPYIKWFTKGIGAEGLYKMISAFEDKSAYAMCIFAFQSGQKDDPPIIFKGITNGTMVPVSGPLTFGFDPVFKPNGYEDTFATMNKEEKNKISHRRKALDAMRLYFEKK